MEHKQDFEIEPAHKSNFLTPKVPKNRRAASGLLVVTGAALMAGSAVIHLGLWAGSYSFIPSIGPLFLAQGIAGLVLALVVVAFRRPVSFLAGAGYLGASIAGLLVSTQVGLFGFQDSLDSPYARQSLVFEGIGVLVLLAATALSLVGSRVKVSKEASVESTRTESLITEEEPGASTPQVSDAAIERGRQVLSRLEVALGPDHPSTLTALVNLVCQYRYSGRNVEALALQERVLVDSERILGPDHPHTRTSRRVLAKLRSVPVTA